MWRGVAWHGMAGFVRHFSAASGAPYALADQLIHFNKAPLLKLGNSSVVIPFAAARRSWTSSSRDGSWRFWTPGSGLQVLEADCGAVDRAASHRGVTRGEAE